MPRGIDRSSKTCGTAAGRPGKRGRPPFERGAMRVFITGTEGYIGCLMAPAIAACGHEIVGLDTGYFVEARLGSEPDAPLRAINKDLRNITRADLEGFDAVIHL